MYKVNIVMDCKMPKQRKSPALPSEGGRKLIHSTEQYFFQSGEITSDFVWSHLLLLDI